MGVLSDVGVEMSQALSHGSDGRKGWVWDRGNASGGDGDEVVFTQVCCVRRFVQLLLMEGKKLLDSCARDDVPVLL